MVTKILDQQVEKRALKILSGIKNLEKKHTDQHIEETSEITMSITTPSTIVTFKISIKRQHSSTVISYLPETREKSVRRTVATITDKHC